MIEAEEALWAPITLHWGWELDDDFAGSERLCDRLHRSAPPTGADFLERRRRQDRGARCRLDQAAASARLARSASTTRSRRSSPRCG